MNKESLVRMRQDAATRGACHIDLACDIIQAAHIYTKHHGITGALIAVHKVLTDVSEDFRREGAGKL